MNNASKYLSPCTDVKSLESEMLTLCSEFGSLSQLDILTMIDSGKRQAVCLLRLDSPTHEQGLISKLGAVRFGDDLCIIVDMGMQPGACVESSMSGLALV